MDERRLADWLMAQAAQGDGEAFGRLAELVGPAIFRFCLAQLPPGMRDLAGDLRQECLLRAFQARSRFRRGAAVRPWLMGIAMNLVRERRRYRPHQPLDRDPPAAARDRPASESEDLQRAVEALPDRQREAVVCRFLRGLSVAETAQAMGCAEGTVKATVFKAIATLRSQLSDEHE